MFGLKQKSGSILPIVFLLVVSGAVFASVSVFAGNPKIQSRKFTNICTKNPKIAFCKSPSPRTAASPTASAMPSPQIASPALSTAPSASPTPTTSPNPTGAFKFSINNPATTVVCQREDANCYQTVLIAANQTPYTLYNPAAYTGGPSNIITYTDFNGMETSTTSTTTKTIAPGEEALNTIIRIKSPSTPGSYYVTFYLDAKRCNSTTDCVYYGASKHQLLVQVP